MKEKRDAWTKSRNYRINRSDEGRVGSARERAQNSPADCQTSENHPAGRERPRQSRIGRTVGVNRNTVSLWRNRWLLLESIPLDELSVAERLEDLPRPGAPARITADQRCQLEALACAPPEEAGRPISQWTGREIADEMIKRKIVDTISPRHAARLLKRSINSPPYEPLLAQYGKGRSL